MCVAERLLSREAVLAALASIAQYGQPPLGLPVLFDVGTGSYLKHFETEVLEGLIFTGGSTLRFYEGAYGAGKTHFLSRLQELGWKKGMAVAKTDLSQLLGLDDWRGITALVLENLTMPVAGKCVRSLPEILAALGKDADCHEAIERLKKIRLPHVGFQQAMIHALKRASLTEPQWNVLRGFLVGRPITQGVFKAVGMPSMKGPLSKKNAHRVLGTVLRALFLLGVPGTMILFDETEQVLVSGDRPTQKHWKAANWLRQLIDSAMVEGTFPAIVTVIVFTLLPGFLEQAGRHYDALGQRLQIVLDQNKVGWRWPFKPLEMIYEDPSEKYFLNQVAQAFARQLQLWGVADASVLVELRQEGCRVLERRVGSGFRRDVMKALAAVAYRKLSGSTISV